MIEHGRPVAHVAAEFHIARSTLTKWVNHFRAGGPVGLEERTIAPLNLPTRLPHQSVERIESWRRDMKWSARRIAHELTIRGVQCSVRTVTRWLDRLGLNRVRDATPDGESLRAPGKVTARFPGHMLHRDVKKIGKLRDGVGWWAHGRGSAQECAKHSTRVGYTFLHTAIDGFARLAYTKALADEKAATTIVFFARARAFFAAPGITRIVA